MTTSQDLDTGHQIFSQTSSRNEGSLTEKADQKTEPGSFVYLVGWRLSALSLGLSISMLLVNMEISIVGTSLVSITNDLKGFYQAGWVITGYLITYTSMVIIFSKMSDIFGRKPIAIFSMFIFLVFSGGCGAAQTMTQLIVCRVFQGIGAAGSIAMNFVVAYELVPKEKYPSQAAQMSFAIGLGSISGPLIGGAASEWSTWRWVFLLNVPGEVITILILFLSMPSEFPYQGQPSYVAPTWRQRFSIPSLMRLDILGCFLLLGCIMTLVAVLLEAGVQFAWSSGTAISLLVISGLLFIGLGVNEYIVTNEKWQQEPIFPWRFLYSRAWMGTLAISLLSGVPYNIIIIDLPQRFQTLNATSTLQAGIRLLPFNVVMAFGSVLINIFMSKSRIAPIFLLFGCTAIEIVGLALLSTLPADTSFTTAIYGYEVLAGLGIGGVIGISIVLPPHLVEARDLAISGGALIQSRMLGGILGLSICSSVMNNHLTSRLLDLIGPQQLSMLQQTTEVIKGFSPDVQSQVLIAFAEGYNLQMRILIAFAGAQFLVVGLLWRKKQIAIVGAKPT